MRHLLKNKRGFTLIEVMVVMVIISILLLVFIPNLTKNQSVVNSKSCEAVLELVEAQALAYHVDHNQFADSTETLKTEGYIDRSDCPDGGSIQLNGLNASSETQ
ncbi:competence type IV pilus major pilin ComGC [Alkalicoccus chagannorensis]|uniref:competence type IV pilus major pilin ComGC n=1 Tax=Alkalicoccus chagannorensis TaxID=427072 RepID=UPI000409CB1B|nr:competence type IV pilus major pilin ComGC [Alkalicoccus chagannorensis]